MSRVRTEDDGETIPCPHCGARNGDLWDYQFGTRECVEADCGTCGKAFMLTRIVSVDYVAEAEVSDPDAPLAEDCPDAPDAGPWCGKDSPDHWGCTRPPLHIGDHVARGGTPDVLARWPQ